MATKLDSIKVYTQRISVIPTAEANRALMVLGDLIKSKAYETIDMDLFRDTIQNGHDIISNSSFYIDR
jgi:hypothetical protein